MMRFEYDPRLVEQATYLAARGDAAKECMLHERLDPLYRIGDVELRQRAFRVEHGEWFRRFGLEQVVPDLVRGFRLTTDRLERCIIREADRRRAQSVDLYSDPYTDGGGGRILIIALCPELLLKRETLGPWLNRELQHIEDMLDETFGYATDVPGASACEQNLIRDRYAVLWNLHVEGRLLRRGKIDGGALENLWGMFARAFTREGRPPGRGVFERLLVAGRLTHAQLMTWAANPAALSPAEGKSFP